MNLTARIKSNTLEIFDPTTGGIQRTIQLPTGQYSNTIIADENVTVTIKTPIGLDRIRTYNMKTGSMVTDLTI